MQTETVIIKSYEYLMEKSFERIKNNKEWDETFKPYNIKFLDKLLEYFTEKEEYEKCSIVYKLKEKKIKHEDKYDNR